MSFQFNKGSLVVLMRLYLDLLQAYYGRYDILRVLIRFTVSLKVGVHVEQFAYLLLVFLRIPK